MTASQTKTDNGHLRHKLELRRHFLRKYHADTPPHVFDCCQGSKVIWTTLQSEFATASYWGVDLKPKKGRVKIDSERVLNQSGWRFDVIDCDTYGAPWKHWQAIAKHATRPITAFLTIGCTMFNGSTDNAALDALGLGAILDKLPSAFRRFLSGMSTEYSLITIPLNAGLKIVEAIEAEADGNARYIGVRLEPRAVA